MKETPRWWFLRTAAVVTAGGNGSMVAFAGLIARASSHRVAAAAELVGGDEVVPDPANGSYIL